MYKKYIIVFGLVLFIYVIIINAWVCDDAYITLRTVDNFTGGYGLSWNPGERVQAYTHPLWMFLLSFFYLLTNNSYLMPVILSILLSISTIYIIIRYLSSDAINTLVLLLLAVLSKSFIDYTSSGLENPLSYFILALFWYFHFSGKQGSKVFAMTLLASCAALNRYDLALLTLPGLIHELLKPANKKYKQVIAGLMPLVLWLCFSFVYYGFLIPNTAFAKLNAGIPQAEYFNRGIRYFANSIEFDPITLTVILSAVVYSVYRLYHSNDKRFIAPLLSIVLYNLFIIYIGGDFMSGRYFSVLFLLSLVILSQIRIQADKLKLVFYRATPFIPLVLIGLLNSKSPLYSWVDYGKRDDLELAKGRIPFTDDNLITDERAFYYQYNGLLPVLLKGMDEPDNDYRVIGLKSMNNAPLVINAHSIGIFSFYAGPDNYIIDEYSLSDAFLSKLPQECKPNWRIGHIQRVIPEGYIQSKIENKNLLTDNNLKQYYGHIKKIISGDLFDCDRLGTIFNLNLGKYDYLLAEGYTESDYPVLTSGDSTTLSYYYNDMSLYSFYSKNNVKDALYFAFKSISYNQIFDFIYYNTGIYYWKGLNKHQKSIGLIRKAIKLNNKLSEGYKALAEIYTELGMPDSAIYYNNIFNKLNSLNYGR